MRIMAVLSASEKTEHSLQDEREALEQRKLAVVLREPEPVDCPAVYVSTESQRDVGSVSLFIFPVLPHLGQLQSRRMPYGFEEEETHSARMPQVPCQLSSCLWYICIFPQSSEGYSSHKPD